MSASTFLPKLCPTISNYSYIHTFIHTAAHTWKVVVVLLVFVHAFSVAAADDDNVCLFVCLLCVLNCSENVACWSSSCSCGRGES